MTLHARKVGRDKLAALSEPLRVRVDVLDVRERLGGFSAEGGRVAEQRGGMGAIGGRGDGAGDSWGGRTTQQAVMYVEVGLLNHRDVGIKV